MRNMTVSGEQVSVVLVSVERRRKRKHPGAGREEIAGIVNDIRSVHAATANQIENDHKTGDGGREHREAAESRGVAGDGPDGWSVRLTCGGRVHACDIAIARNPLSFHVFGVRRGEEAVRAIKVATK